MLYELLIVITGFIVRKFDFQNISGLAVETKNEIPDLGTVLGLPELPFEPPKKVSTIGALSTSSFDDDNEIDYDEYSEDGKLQLLPKKSAGKSVARFHKDREQPDVRLVPPPLPSSTTSSPLQLVGHILDQVRSVSRI